jgi:hypothetical protein
VRKFVIASILIILAFSGCTERQLSAGEIRDQMMDSDKNPETYRFVTDAVHKITTFANSTNSSYMVVWSRDVGTVNLTAQSMKIVTEKNASLDHEALRPIQREIYVFLDWEVIKLNGNWSNRSLQYPDAFWERQNITQSQAELLNQSQMELSGSEVIDGRDCYRINAVPDIEAYETMLMEQMGFILPLDCINLTELYKSSDLSWTLWVSEDDDLLRKDHLEMRFVVTPEMTDLPPEEIADFPLKIDLNITTLYSDYNLPVDIALPEGVQIIHCAGCV